MNANDDIKSMTLSYARVAVKQVSINFFEIYKGGPIVTEKIMGMINEKVYKLHRWLKPFIFDGQTYSNKCISIRNKYIECREFHILIICLCHLCFL